MPANFILFYFTTNEIPPATPTVAEITKKSIWKKKKKSK